MKIALVDDRPEELELLSGMLSRRLDALGDSSHRIQTYPSGEAFLADWKAGEHDLIILDIFMGGISGVEVARTIRKTDREVRLVFCTTSNEFASESYEVGAHYYLHKPYSEERIWDMLSRLNLEDYELRRAVSLPDGQKIMLRNLLYTEYSNHQVLLHQKRGGDLRCRMAQAELEALLADHRYFLVCSKGVVVNLYEVTALSEGTFLLSDGSRLPISRRKAKEVADAYADFNFERLRREV